MKDNRRIQIANGFATIGAVGLLVGALVIPDKWISDQINIESQIILLVSFACVSLAAVFARSFRFGVSVLLGVIFVACAMYLAIVPFVAAERGWQSLGGSLGFITLILVVAGVASFFGMRFLRAPNKALKTDAPKDGARLS